jgi:hypothetical protein
VVSVCAVEIVLIIASAILTMIVKPIFLLGAMLILHAVSLQRLRTGSKPCPHLHNDTRVRSGENSLVLLIQYVEL